MAPASGIGPCRRGSGHGFVSGDPVWLRVYGLASGVFVESIVKAGMRDSFGTVQPSGKPGEKRKHCKVSVKGLEARRQQQSVCFFS